jgi:hypothetical protein
LSLWAVLEPSCFRKKNKSSEEDKANSKNPK